MKFKTTARYPNEFDLHNQTAARVHDGSGLEDYRDARKAIRARKRQNKKPGKAWKNNPD